MGEPGGFPVLVLLHGTPECRLERWPDEDVYRRLNVLVVTHDRAGYGRSTRRPGRTVVDEVDDVVALADHLGLERFGVTGGSDGGAHALACAALLPDRVVRAGCVVGVAPSGHPGLDQDAWLEGMDPENVKEFRWALAGEEVLIRGLEAEHAKLAARVAEDRTSVLDAFDGATDVLVPPAHGEWLAANVPGCVVKVDGDAGHLVADPEEAIAEEVRWLRDGVLPPGATAASS